jgi:hypothetical protein
MRSARTADRQAIQRTLDAMVTLLEAGHTEVPIERVVRLLGRELQKAGPGGTPSSGSAPPDPQADPLTGARWAGPPGSSPPGVR